MLHWVVIIIIIALSVQVFPVALGLRREEGFNHTIWYALLLLTGQVVMFLAGYVLGSRFMHLMDDLKGIVLFVGFSLISIRMIIDSFKVRRGERTFDLSNTLSVVLASLVQAINTFLAAMLLTYLPFERQWLSMILTISTLIMIGSATIMKPGKTSLSLSSLLFFLGGIWMLFASVFLGFYR